MKLGIDCVRTHWIRGFTAFCRRSDDLIVLSWQEHIGSTVVHVLDLSASRAYTAVTPAKGGFMRLTGRIEVKSET
jgi:hypothetical protein